MEIIKRRSIIERCEIDEGSEIASLIALPRFAELRVISDEDKSADRGGHSTLQSS